MLARGELGDEFMGIVTADGAGRCQQTDVAVTGQGGGRLDRGDHADHGNAECGTQGWQGNGAGGIAGDHHQIDGVLRHHVADQSGTSLDEGRLTSSP